jgi:IclR family transcriptional regulator, acetate operon repressor
MAKSPTSTSARTGTQAIERAVSILTVLESGPESVSLTEMANHIGLSLSTTHRLARALCDAGLLRQDHNTERYGLGRRLITLGQQAGKVLGLAAARATMHALALETGESVNLGVLEADHVIVLACVPSAQRLRFDQEVGSRVPAYASAMGKALLAYVEEADLVLDNLPRLAKLTGSTITSRGALRADLDEVRARGWAFNDEERELGVRTIAAPVLDPDRRPVAAIAVQGPSVRITDARLPRLATQVRKAAADVAIQLVAPL